MLILPSEVGLCGMQQIRSLISQGQLMRCRFTVQGSDEREHCSRLRACMVIHSSYFLATRAYDQSFCKSTPLTFTNMTSNGFRLMPS